MHWLSGVSRAGSFRFSRAVSSNHKKKVKPIETLKKAVTVKRKAICDVETVQLAVGRGGAGQSGVSRLPTV